MSPKTLYLVLLLLLILVIIILVQVFAYKEQSADQQRPAQSFRIIKTNISPHKPVNVSQPIEVTFSQSVATASLKLAISPIVPLSTSVGLSPTKLVITPVKSWGKAWDYSTSYTIQILKGTASQTGSTLDQNYQFSFATEQYID